MSQFSQFIAPQNAGWIIVVMVSLTVLALLYEKWSSRHVSKELPVPGEDMTEASQAGSEHMWSKISALQNAILAHRRDGWIIPARLISLYMELQALSKVFLHVMSEEPDTHTAFLLAWLEELLQRFEEIEAENEETRESQEDCLKRLKDVQVEMGEMYQARGSLAYQRLAGMLHLLEVMIDDEVDSVHLSSYIGVMLKQQRALSRRFQLAEKNLLKEASGTVTERVWMEMNDLRDSIQAHCSNGSVPLWLKTVHAELRLFTTMFMRLSFEERDHHEDFLVERLAKVREHFQDAESAQRGGLLQGEFSLRQLKSEYAIMGDLYPQMQGSLAYQRLAGMQHLLELLAEDQDVPMPLLDRSITVVNAQLRVLVSQYKRVEQQSAINTPST